jgi:predicted transcriptional regulator
MTSETVRIHPRTHAKLKQLAADTNESMTDVLEQAVDAYARRRFLESLNQDFAALRGNAQAWTDETAEREAWDATLRDGLERDDGAVGQGQASGRLAAHRP